MLYANKRSKIKTVELLKSSQDPEILSKKQSVLDVLCTDDRDRKYIIEMQVASSKGFEKRAQYYAAKAYANQLNSTERYFQLKEVIFLAITNFVMFPDKADYKSDHVILDKITYSHDLRDFSFTFLELPKFIANDQAMFAGILLGIFGNFFNKFNNKFNKNFIIKLSVDLEILINKILKYFTYLIPLFITVKRRHMSLSSLFKYSLSKLSST
jgi:predicted transposase/invertase (TIGR01784 family)